MAKRASQNADWTGRGRVEQASKADQLRAERARDLLKASKEKSLTSLTSAQVNAARLGVRTPTSIRYARKSTPKAWSGCELGRPIVDVVLDSARDGADRVVMAWPHRPGSGFVAAALAMREARAAGTLAHATMGYWPWRPGATSAARSILVNPEDLLTCAKRVSTECEAGASWARSGLDHRSLYMTELRLGDLISVTQATKTPTASKDIPVVVHSPTLLETTAVFPPVAGGRNAYAHDSGQVLKRVLSHTQIRKLESHVGAVGDPDRTPFAVMGLDAHLKPEDFRRFLQCERFSKFGLDVIIVDLTEAARQAVGPHWDDALKALLLGLDRVKGRRPPLAVLCDDPHSMRRAVKLLRMHGSTMRPPRRGPVEIGIYLDTPGMIGPRPILPENLPPVTFEADIKDASLAPLRSALLSFGSELREEKESDAAKAVSGALTFLRRAVSLPFGMEEARSIADVIYDGDDDVDLAVRAMFRSKMALAKLAALADLLPSKGSKAVGLADQVMAKVAAWTDETPVSARLARMLDTAANSGSGIGVVVATRTVADLFSLSDRSQRWKCDIVASDDLAAALTSKPWIHLVVVGPNPEVLRTLLISPRVPRSVSLLGDSAGVGLLAAELAPIERLPAFSALADRAIALRRALLRGGADETLDISEASFEATTPVVPNQADFTRSGEVYRGDIVVLKTSRGGTYRYRPTGVVLVHSPGELRPFVPQEARRIQNGDHILALSPDIHETLRRAISGSRKARSELEVYHKQVATRRDATPGKTLTEKVRYVIEQMRRLDPTVNDVERHNVRRWLTADQAVTNAEGGRQPGAARQWERFRTFWGSGGMAPFTADMYWRMAIIPTRSYRVQEGLAFNQRVTQFVLDPEGTSLGAGQWAAMPQLWQMVEAAVDEVYEVSLQKSGGEHSNG